MSLSAGPGFLIFGRVLTLPRLSMFTGGAFGFRAEEADNLLAIAAKIHSRDCPESEKSRRLFRKYFQLHRTRGIEVVYR